MYVLRCCHGSAQKRDAAQNKNHSPHQSPSVTASPHGEALDFRKPVGVVRPLASPFGRGVRAQRGRRGAATTPPTLSVACGDSSPKGRAKGLPQIRSYCKNREGSPLPVAFYTISCSSASNSALAKNSPIVISKPSQSFFTVTTETSRRHGILDRHTSTPFPPCAPAASRG